MCRNGKTWREITAFVLAAIIIGTSLVAPSTVEASPKSLYLVADHHTRQFDAWEVKPDGTTEYQKTYPLAYATDPAGIAIDESSNTLFITSEFSGGVEMVDATTMTSLGVCTGPSDLAGIVVDDAKDIVYAVKRYSSTLYAYDWNPVARTLTLKSGYPISLPGCSGAFGIALDEIRGILWVADSAAGIVRAYDVNTWTEDTSKSFTPSHKAVDVTVDRWRGFVYSVSMSAGAWTPPGTGSTLLSKYEVATGTETTGNLVDQGVGVAVDEVTGYVYVTISPYRQGAGVPAPVGLEVWDASSSPWTRVQTAKVSGSPAGICIPQEEVAYNPLGLGKDDGLAEGECISPAFGKIVSALSSLDDHPLHQLPATSGKISWFSSEESGSPGAWGEWLGENVGTDDATKYWYCAMRWPYKLPDGSIDYDAKAWWHNKKILVTNPDNGKQVVLAAKDWGPSEWTGRVIDVSKTALDVLGAETDEVVNIVFADQNAKLGPVENDVIIYEICYDNTKNDIDVHNVRIIDTLPAEVSFISTITSGGTYDPSTHTVTWDIGTLSAWATQQCVHLVVRVYPTVTPGSTIINYATIDSDETLPTTVSESTDVCPLPGEIGLLVDVAAKPPEGKDHYEINDDIEFEVTVTNPADIAGTELTAYYVKLSVIEPEAIEIDVPAGGINVEAINPGESKSTTFYGTAIKAGDNAEVIVNAWGYTDLSAEVGKVRGRGSCIITIRDEKAPKPDWSFAIITDLHIGYGIPDYNGEGWNDSGPGEDDDRTEMLENAVDKIITEKGPYNIELVVVLGDISDTAEKSEFLKAREILNKLNDAGIPYIPVIGDHDQWSYIQKEGVNLLGERDRGKTVDEQDSCASGDGYFSGIFWGGGNSENLQLIKDRLGDFWLPGNPQPAYLQNRAFSYTGISFVCLDFNPEKSIKEFWKGGAFGPIATHYSETKKFLDEYLQYHQKNHPGQPVMIFSHHPLYELGGYSPTDDIAYIVYDHECSSKLYNFAGHTHCNRPKPGEVGGYIVTYPGIFAAGPVLKTPVYEVIETEPVGHIKCECELTGEVIRIVQVKNGEIDDYSTVLKPKKVEIRWPFPQFAYSFASYPEPNKDITFTAYYTTYHGFKTSFDWDFRDGSYGSGSSVTHSYSQEGDYEVTLTVTTKNLITDEKTTQTISELVYVRSKHVISSLPSNLYAASLLTGEDLTQVPKNTYEPVLITKASSEETPVAELGVHFEEANEDIDLSSLVADVDIAERKSVLYMPTWPEEIENYKTLFIPSTGVGAIYICKDAKSLAEVSLENADTIINIGETKDGMSVTTTFYNGREYYLVCGITGTGGGEAANTPPVADAGPDQTVYVTPPATTAEVTLDGSGSYDPDGDPLTYNWTWDGNSATGVSPTVELPSGTTTITLVVNDGELDSAPDTVRIIVKEAVIPAVGGEAFPPNKLAILAHWLVVAAAIIAGASIVLRRRSDQG